MTYKYILLVFSVVTSLLTGNPIEGYGQSTGVRLSSRLSTNGKELALNIAPTSSTSSCTYTVLGSTNRSRLRSTSSRLFTIGGSSSRTQVKGKNLLSVKSNSKIHFAIRTVCSKDSSTSNSISISLKGSSTGVVSSQWLSDTAKKLILGSLKVKKAFSLTFDRPIDLQNAGDGSKRIFVAEQGGKIWVFDGASTTPTKILYLDLSSKIETGGSEQGLLGITFHPDFENNKYFFVHYSKKGSGDTMIERYQEDGTTKLGSSNSGLAILEQSQPFENHNGGQIQFGKDGYLYIALGDGGSGGDPQGNGQHLGTLLGKILRIDINNTANGKNYAIPTDNPFRGNTSGQKEEIFAYGLRNPWRFSFDSSNGRLWAADVGQSALEEVNIIESGKNYGWNTMEGSRCFNPSSGCSTSGLVLPVTEYGRGDGQSITGGYVYRGTRGNLKGLYFFGDFVSGKLWALSYDGSKATRYELFDSDLNISSFGVDENRELYILSYSDGSIYRLN